MSVRIRMVRRGRKNEPHYRIVVSDKRSKLDGAFIENLGTYEPKAKEAADKLNIKEESLVKWLRQGAQISPALTAILKHAGKMPALTGKPKQEKAKAGN